jgi:Ca2+-binding EF-hand superfamily protein
VFDALDVDSSGHVSFEELNVILALNDLELSEFVRRMNELAGYKKHRESATRPVFVKYFLQLLKETSNLTVSFKEAEELFDEMADNGKVKLDEVHMSNFYNSSMSDFLSDIQICDLIKVRISTPSLPFNITSQVLTCAKGI